MRVIITGGTGLIGRALATGLAADGAEVIVLSRSEVATAALPQGVRAKRWDGRTAAGWGHLADGADAVVNLAGESIAEGRWTQKRKDRIRQSRLNVGRAVVEAAEAAHRKPGVVVQSSAVGYYGPRADEEIGENEPPGSDFLARLTVEWEASTAPVEALGVRRVITRSAVVLSAESTALRSMLLPYRLFIGGKLGSGRQWFPWIHIADEIAAIRFLIDRGDVGGAFNLCAPGSLTNAEFAKALGRAARRPSFMPTPGFGLRLLFGDKAAVLLTGQRQVPRRLEELGFTFGFPEAEPALRDLLGRRPSLEGVDGALE